MQSPRRFMRSLVTRVRSQSFVLDDSSTCRKRAAWTSSSHSARINRQKAENRLLSLHDPLLSPREKILQSQWPPRRAPICAAPRRPSPECASSSNRLSAWFAMPKHDSMPPSRRCCALSPSWRYGARMSSERNDRLNRRRWVSKKPSEHLKKRALAWRSWNSFDLFRLTASRGKLDASDYAHRAPCLCRRCAARHCAQQRRARRPGRCVTDVSG